MHARIRETWLNVLANELKYGDYEEAFQTIELLVNAGQEVSLTNEQYAILILESSNYARKYGAYINWDLVSIID